MKPLALLFCLLMTVRAQALTYYQYTANYGSVGDSLTETSIGQSAEGYWTNRFIGAGSTTKQFNPTWVSNAGQIVAGTWASAGNTKTAFSNMTITARFGTSSRAYIWARWGGAYNAGNAHPTSGYTAAYAVGTYFIYENDATGIANILASVAGTPANLNDFDFRFIVNGSNLALYVDGVFKLSASDNTFTTGGIGLTNFSGTLWFDDVIVGDGAMGTNRSIYLDQFIYPDVSRGLRPPKWMALFMPFQARAHVQNQLWQQEREKTAYQEWQRSTGRVRVSVTPSPTRTPRPIWTQTVSPTITVTSTATPTREPRPSATVTQTRTR